MSTEKAIAKKTTKIVKLLEKAETGDAKKVDIAYKGLLKLMGDTSEQVRIASIEALVQIYCVNAVLLLIPALGDPHGAVRKANIRTFVIPR